MDYQGIRETLRDIHGANAPIERNGQWVTTRCPFAQWTHPRGTDRSPSFGILENENGKSVFHCFTCKRKGTVAMLWDFLGGFDGNDYSEFVADAESSEILGPRLPTWEATSYERNADRLDVPLSEEVNLVYESASAAASSRKYLRERKITRQTADTLGLLYDPDDGHGQDRVLFPVRDIGGSLYGYTGRGIASECDPRVRDYYGLNKRLLLLGSHDCRSLRDAGGDPVLLVEGLFDYAKVRQAGFECVASMGSRLTPAQLQVLKRLGRTVAIMYDNDGPGKEGKDSVAQALRYHIPLFKVRYPTEGKSEDWKKAHADPGSLTCKRIQQMMSEARLMLPEDFPE